jgi:hypothetical protein
MNVGVASVGWTYIICIKTNAAGIEMQGLCVNE